MEEAYIRHLRCFDKSCTFQPSQENSDPSQIIHSMVDTECSALMKEFVDLGDPDTADHLIDSLGTTGRHHSQEFTKLMDSERVGRSSTACVLHSAHPEWIPPVEAKAVACCPPITITCPPIFIGWACFRKPPGCSSIAYADYLFDSCQSVYLYFVLMTSYILYNQSIVLVISNEITVLCLLRFLMPSAPLVNLMSSMVIFFLVTVVFTLSWMKSHLSLIFSRSLFHGFQWRRREEGKKELCSWFSPVPPLLPLSA